MFNRPITLHLTKSKSVPVSSFEEASRLIRSHWGSKTMTAFLRDPKAGLMLQPNSMSFNVSYNGCVWVGTDRMSTKSICVYEAVK